jgi:hypothetical protein
MGVRKMDMPWKRSGLSMLAVAFVFVIATGAQAEVSLRDKEAIKNQQQSTLSKIGTPTPKIPGAIGLIDAGGLRYHINTNITFSTNSSASGAMKEAEYTHAVAATTSLGGTVSATLTDAFDGYNTLCFSANNTVTQCTTGNANYSFYNMLGPASLDGTCSNRQVIFPVQTFGSLQVQRKVFVPTNDSFARWLNILTNPTGSPVTLTMVMANNLGSDSNTLITGSSSGDLVATTADTWVSSFQNYSGTTSTDPRLGHVLWGAGASVPLTGVNFVDGNDRPFWGYTFTLSPGQTRIIMNFVTGQPSKAAANAQAALLAGLLPPASMSCMTLAERFQVANFNANPAPQIPIPALGWQGLLILALLLGTLGYSGFRFSNNRKER